MDINLLRKRLQEIRDSIAAGTMPAIPGFEVPSQPAAPSPVDTYNPPETVVPDVQVPETTPVTTQPASTPAITPAVNTPVPSTNTTSNQTKVDPKTGANGAKTFDDITTKSPQFGEEGMGHDDLVNAYNAGLNGEDMSRETRDNAATGGYLEQLEAMYNAGLQDAKPTAGDNTKVNVPNINPAVTENNSKNGVDNKENLNYTSGKTTMITGADDFDEIAPVTSTVNYGMAAKSTNNSTSSDKPYQISDSEKELNYMMDMLFMNGAASSNDPSVQAAYAYVSNPDNKGKPIPQEVYDAYYSFMGKIGDEQIARSNRIAVGKDDELGLVGNIYANKPKTPASPEVKPVVPVSDSDSSEGATFGKAGQNALGEIIKPDPKTFGSRSGYLYEAYQAGLNGIDLSQELKDNAAAGGFLDDIEKMYNAGETDAKIAADDSRNKDDVPYMGAEDDTDVPDIGADDENLDVPNMGADDKNRAVKYKFGGRVIYQDEYDAMTDKQKKALDDALKDYNSKKQSGENFMSLFDTYMKLISAAGQVFDPKEYKTDKDFDEAFKQAEEELKNYHLDYESSTAPYTVKDQYKNEFNSLFDRIYKKISTRPVYEEAKKNTSKFNVSLADLVKSIEDSKTQPVNQTSNTDSIALKPDIDFYKKILDSLNGESSKDMEAYQKAYEYFNNSANAGKDLSEDIKSALITLFQSVDNDTKAGILKGMGLEGLGKNDKFKNSPYDPDKYHITQGFDDIETDHKGHLGYDVTGAYESDIFPILPGKVAFIQNSYSSGNGIVVVIEHEAPDGTIFYSTYSHLHDAVQFSIGDTVGTTDVIGHMGHSGKSESYKKGKLDNEEIGIHVHIAVFTAPSDDPNIDDPEGYSYNNSATSGKSFEDTAKEFYCDYNDYYCITARQDKLYINFTFFDPYIVMMTNGGIISMFQKVIKREGEHN